MTEVSRVAVVGTGAIGAGWAALFLARGLDVIATDPDAGAEGRLRESISTVWPALSRLGLADTADPARLRFVDDVAEAVESAQFVQENGPERLAVKQQIIADLDEATPPGTPIASSTSGLTATELQAMCTHDPGRILVGHPFHPAYLIPLVEVVPGANTHTDVVDMTLAFYAEIGKRPILVRQEVPGHVTNRLQAALWREAYSLVERGVATVADVDAAIANGPGLRWAALGPVVLQHLSGGPGGLDHTLRHLGPPAQVWMDDLGSPTLTPDLAAQLVAGVDDELSGVDQEQLVADRDAFLVAVLEEKRRHPTLS